MTQVISAFEMEQVIYSVSPKTILTIDKLSLEEGKVYALVGPSGSGKTTLLRIMNLLLSPNQGKLLYWGREIPNNQTEKLAIQRSMSMVFQKPVLFSGNVFYNVSLGMKLRGMKDKEIKNNVAAALEAVGIEHLAKQNAFTISGGEAQRVALARAIVTRPKILLLDEFTANLDPANVAGLESVIKNIHVQSGLTTIMASHNLNQARRLSDETIFLHNGAVVEKGPTEQIFSEAKESTTRAFVSGEMIY